MKKVLKILAAILTATFVLFMTGCANASGGGSGDSGETQSGGSISANNYPSTTVAAADAAQTIATLTENTTVVLTGALTESDITAIRQAIYSCSHFINLDLSNTTELTSINWNDFACCTKLTGISLPASVTSIGNSAFMLCTSLTQISIPSSVTLIENSAFMDCTALSQITIPASVTSIGGSAFDGCTALTNITFEDTTTWYTTNNVSNFNQKTGGTLFEADNLTDTEQNATYFKNTYRSLYWYKL